MAPGLTSGGSVAILYGYIAAAIGAGFVAASLSEIGSIWPTSGGQYHWAAELSPPKMRPLISWYAGWLANAALWLSCLSAGFAAATQINAYIIVCNPDYVPERYHTVLMYLSHYWGGANFSFWAVLLLGVCVNVFGIKLMHGLNIGAMIIHGCGFICVIAVMSAMGSHHDAAFVFTSFQNLSGWSSDGVAWCLGLLTTSYGFVGYDAAAHMSEEMKNAARDMPRAMFGSVVVSGVLTFPYIIALLFAIGDIDVLLASPTGSPITQLFVNVTGSNAGGIALNCIITIIATVATTGISSVAVESDIDFLASCSRTTWAFARDNGIPFPRFFAHVSKRWGVPVNAIVLAATLQALLSLIFIGNTTAFNAFIALSTVGINLSYCLPVLLYLVYGRWHLEIEKGPFNLGPYGPFINFVAICWTLFLTVFLMFPSYQPVDPVYPISENADISVKYELRGCDLGVCLSLCDCSVVRLGSKSLRWPCLRGHFCGAFLG